MPNSVVPTTPHEKLEISNSILAPGSTSAQESKSTFPEQSISLGGEPKSYTTVNRPDKNNRLTTSMNQKFDRCSQNRTNKKHHQPNNKSLHQQ